MYVVKCNVASCVTMVERSRLKKKSLHLNWIYWNYLFVASDLGKVKLKHEHHLKVSNCAVDQQMCWSV